MRDEIGEGDSTSPSMISAAMLADVRGSLSLRDLAEDGNRPGRGKAVRTGGARVIRQAISCDICGTEKKQTNHWFVAYDQGEELRVSGWNSRNRLRPGFKHLCGQTCVHKLVDDFMARALTTRVPQAAQIDVDDEYSQPPKGAD